MVVVGLKAKASDRDSDIQTTVAIEEGWKLVLMQRSLVAKPLELHGHP